MTKRRDQIVVTKEDDIDVSKIEERHLQTHFRFSFFLCVCILAGKGIRKERLLVCLFLSARASACFVFVEQRDGGSERSKANRLPLPPFGRRRLVCRFLDSCPVSMY